MRFLNDYDYISAVSHGVAVVEAILRCPLSWARGGKGGGNEPVALSKGRTVIR